MEEHGDMVAELRVRCAVGDLLDDVGLLRVAMVHPDDVAAAEAALRNVLKWRRGEGKAIVEAATAAVQAATAAGGWDNSVVFAAAPNSDRVAPYISSTGSQLLELSLADTGDLVKVIRAAAIDDKGLMSQVTPEEMVDFFLYATEVNWQVLNARSTELGRLCKVITANDLSGINLFGDATFRNVLSASSKQANSLYPNLAGPTLLLNLPPLLGALVKVFKPLFPEAVQKKLKFEQGPLRDVKDLTELLGPSSSARSTFFRDLKRLLA